MPENQGAQTSQGMQEVENPWKIKIGRSPHTSGIEYEGKPVNHVVGINVNCEVGNALTTAEITLIAPSVTFEHLEPTVENRELVIEEIKGYILAAQIKQEELYGE